MNNLVIASIIILASNVAIASPLPLIDIQSQNRTKLPVGSTIALIFDAVSKLPEIRAQEAKYKQLDYEVTNASLPIYNPEVGINFSRSSRSAYELSLSQTVDIYDKASAVSSVSNIKKQLGFLENSIERNKIMGDGLLAAVGKDIIDKEFAFLQYQHELSLAQFDIAKKREAAGDISKSELYMLQLGLFREKAELAIIKQKVLVMKEKLLSTLGVEIPISEQFISSISSKDSMLIDIQLPALEIEYKRVILAKYIAESTRLTNKPDPTLNVNAGKDGQEKSFTLGVTIPLQIRNNYNYLNLATNENVIIAEQNYIAKERELTQAYRKFENSLTQLLSDYQMWQFEYEPVSNSSHQFIIQQWELGDISTSDYLATKQQLLMSYQIGFQLELSIFEEWISWMALSGQLEIVLNDLRDSAALNG